MSTHAGLRVGWGFRLAPGPGHGQIEDMAKLKTAVHYFLVGLGSVLTVQASAKPSYLTRPIKDKMAGDWIAVGEDIASGIKQFPETLTMVQPELNLDGKRA